MSAGRIRHLAARREGAEDAGVPAALRGRRRARADRGRVEEARRRLARVARADRGRARAPRAGGARARRRDAAARSSPATTGGCTRSSATSGRSPASAAHTRTRSSIARSCRRSRSRASSATRRSSASPRRSRRTWRGRSSCGSPARATRTSTASTGRLGEPCPRCGDPLRQVDYEEHTVFYCARLPDRRPDPQGPADVPAAALDGLLGQRHGQALAVEHHLATERAHETDGDRRRRDP